MNTTRPPGLVRSLLSFTLPSGIVRESVIGDLDEEYRGLCETHGVQVARAWYRREALGTLRYALGTRVVPGGRRPLVSSTKSPPNAPRWRPAFLRPLGRDIVSALRGLTRSPVFSAIAVATTALGIGAAVMVFSVVDGVLLRPLPYPDPASLVRVGFHRESGRVSPSSAPFVRAWREGSTRLGEMTATTVVSKVLGGAGDPTVLRTVAATPEYFTILDVPFALGSALGSEWSAVDAPAVVISHTLWQSRWAGDPEILGRSIVLNDTAFTVAGVVGPGFHPPEALMHAGADLWIPLSLTGPMATSSNDLFIHTIARLLPGSGLDQARQELRVLSDPVVHEFPANYAPYFIPDVQPLREQTVGSVSARLYTLFGAVAFLLLIACVNVANLFLARGADRAQELDVRMALGASRSSIVRLLLTESVLVSLLGSGIGAALATVGLRVFRAMTPGDIPRMSEVQVDARVLGFAFVVALGTGVLFGLVPATSATRRRNLGMHTGASRQTGSRERHRLRNALVVVEMAAALVLAIGGGLLLNSFVRLSSVDPGFDVTNVETLSVRLGPSYQAREERLAFFDELLTRTARQPGVEAAALTLDIPMSGGGIVTTTYLDSHAQAAVGFVANHRVTPDYFDVFGMQLRPGSRPLPAWTASGEDLRVVMVNEAFVSAHWADGSGIGRRIRFDDEPEAPWYTIVGVVSDMRHDELAEPPEPQVYTPYGTDLSLWSAYVTVRTTSAEPNVTPAIRRIVRELDPTIPIGSVMTMTERVRASIAEPRFYTALLATFAAIAMSLAAVGIFSTMTYLVARRSKELGIRMALGASRDSVFGLVLRQAGSMALVGATLGAVTGVASSRLLEGFMFGVTPTDPLTFATAAGLLMTVALLACIAPALRATTVDPVKTLTVD